MAICRDWEENRLKFYFSEGAFCFQMVGFLKIDYGLGDILWRKTLPEFR